MVLAYAIMGLIVIALLLRRDLSLIGQLPYRGGWGFLSLIIGLFLLQALMVLYVPGQSTGQMLLLITTQLALIGLFWVNRHIAGAKLFALGVALNVIVMVANGGWMPVTPETYNYIYPDRNLALYTRPPSSKNILLPQSEANLWFLSDIFRVTLPWRRNAISLGDIVLILGVAQFIFQTTSQINKQVLTSSNN